MEGGGRDGCSSKQTGAVAASQRTVTSRRPPSLPGLGVPPTPGLSLFFLAPVTGAATFSPAVSRPLAFPWEAPGPQAGSASLVALPVPEGDYPGQGVTATGVFTLAQRVPAGITNWSLILGPLAPHTVRCMSKRKLKYIPSWNFTVSVGHLCFFLNLSVPFSQ